VLYWVTVAISANETNKEANPKYVVPVWSMYRLALFKKQVMAIYTIQVNPERQLGSLRVCCKVVVVLLVVVLKC